MLIRKRIDILLHFSISVTETLRSNYPEAPVRMISDGLVEVPLYHYLHKRNKHHMPKLELVIRQMIASGERNRLVEAVLMKRGLEGEIELR